jgi:hypothetical protein
MKSPAYLVQVRAHGEPWKTVERYPTQRSAERLACLLAHESRRWRETPTGGLVDHPEHAYVRVTCGGATVFDPRAPHSNVAPSSPARHAQSAPALHGERASES